jgi:Ser/Thr protein kinase RdoA (MazF antagonist)
MKPFHQLTRRGKARRRRRLAIHALQQYDLDVAKVQLVGAYTNTNYRVRTTDHHTHLLRVCTPGWRTLTDLQSEAIWLQALHRDTDIGAPVPLPARNGDLVVRAGAPGVPDPHHCTITSWIPGPLLGTRLTESNLSRMGILFAQLHETTAGFVPPPGFTRRRMDNIYARGEEDVLFTEPCRDAFTPRTRDILDRTASRVRAAFADRYADPAGLRVIHNDLHHDNIKVDRGRLRPLDFEDTIWGYPVQDIAMALQDLMTDVPPDAYEPLQDAFRAGYERIRPWPETCTGQIDTFRAGRLIWVANYVARHQRQYLQKHLAWTSRLLEPYLETGILRLP